MLSVPVQVNVALFVVIVPVGPLVMLVPGGVVSAGVPYIAVTVLSPVMSTVHLPPDEL